MHRCACHGHTSCSSICSERDGLISWNEVLPLSECLCKAGAVKGGWEAAFGPLPPQHRAGQTHSAEAHEAVPAVEDLWDAPSHALPAPSMLVNASLEALLGGAA